MEHSFTNGAGLSFVICCYNSEKRITKVLHHLKAQKTKNNIPWEVIVVDNNSSDKTAEIATQFWGSFPVPIRLVFEPKPGLSHARHTGIKEAKFKYVSLIDDDNWVEDRWIEKVYHIMHKHPEAALCGGRGIPDYESTPPQWLDQFTDALAVGPQGESEGPLDPPNWYIYGAGMTIRKSAWNYLLKNGFTSLLSDRKKTQISSGGDSEICLAMRLAGFQVWYTPLLTFSHHIPKSRVEWKYMRKLFRSFGRSSIILDLYKNQINQNKGIRYQYYNNKYMNLLYQLHKYLKLLPSYIWGTIDKSTNKKTVFSHDFYHAALLERVHHWNRYNHFRDTIKNYPFNKNSQ